MLMQQQTILRRPSQYRLHHHLHAGSLGPGLEGDYFETKNEEILIHKLNTLRSIPEPIVIPPLLPRFQSESTIDALEANHIDSPEMFLQALLVEESLFLHKQQLEKGQQSSIQPQHKQRYFPAETKQAEEESKQLKLHRAEEQINTTTTVWKYCRDDPNNYFDPIGTITVEKVPPLEPATGSTQPRPSPPKYLSSPQSVSTLTVSDESGNNPSNTIYKLKKEPSNKSPLTTSTKTTVKRATTSNKSTTTTAIRPKDDNVQELVISDHDDDSLHKEKEEINKETSTASLPNQGREQRKQLLNRLQQLLKDKGDNVAQQQKQQSKATLKLRKSSIPQSSIHVNKNMETETEQKNRGYDKVVEKVREHTSKPPSIPTDSNLNTATNFLQPSPQPQQFQTIRIRRSASFSSSIHDDTDNNDENNYDINNKRHDDYIEVMLPQHFEFKSLKRTSSFSSSIHDVVDNYDDDKLNHKPSTVSTNNKPTPKDPQNHILLVKQEMYTLLQNDDDLEDFKRINNFTFEGDYLLSKILRERSRLQMKKDMLLSNDTEFYVKVHKKTMKHEDNKNASDDLEVHDDVHEERKVLFCC